MNSWKDAQSWEQKWWNNCSNTFGEEFKQLLYANRMGLVFTPSSSTPFRIDMKGKSVLDIGGGPVSLLLKCVNVRGMIVDPLEFPAWIEGRYKSNGIDYKKIKAEEINFKETFDECFIYNVLQHVENPRLVIFKARQAAQLLRVFEWLETAMDIGHPHSLTEIELNTWLKGEGHVEVMSGQNNCFGKGYYGIFLGKKI